MTPFASLADKAAIEAVGPWEKRQPTKTLYKLIERSAKRFPKNKAVSFQITSGPTDKAETLTWMQLMGKINQSANMFRRLGVGENDVVAYLLPNANETVITLLGGAVAG